MFSDSFKLDVLWKLLLDKGFTSEAKQYFEEEFSGIQKPVLGHSVWAQDHLIPEVPPVSTTVPVEVQPDLVLTLLSSVAGNKVFVAADTVGDISTRLLNWIVPQGASPYQPVLYEDDGAGGLGDVISLSDPIEWIFFPNGVLVCQNDPVVAGKTLPFHLKGYRYNGDLGIPPSGGSGDLTRSFTITLPSTTWVLTHNLGKHPSVSLRGQYNGSGPFGVLISDDIIPSISDPLNELTVVFKDPMTGTADLN
jgi:hypothetical protein